MLQESRMREIRKSGSIIQSSRHTYYQDQLLASLPKIGGVKAVRLALREGYSAQMWIITERDSGFVPMPEILSGR